MKKIFFIAACFLAVSTAHAQVPYQAVPEGYGAAATGGGTAAPVIVSDFASLRTNLTAAGPRVILVSGVINIPANQQISAVISNKSLIGLPGAKLVNENLSGSGILNLKNGSNNIIIRNLIFVGPGAYDNNGQDNLTNQGGTNVWIDHCEFQDGQDGNLDNVGQSDNITISWNKFTYLKPPVPGGSGGSNDHRFSNLVGSSATDKPADGHYSITYQSNYWGEGTRERMPRARNAQLHILNSYYYTSVPGAVGIGLGGGVSNSTVFVENTHFAKISSYFKNYVSSDGGSIAINFVNSLTGTSPVPGSMNIGTVSPPNYAYTVMPVADVAKYVADATCGAGATLQVSTAGVITPGQCSNMGTANISKAAVKLYPVPVKDILNIEVPGVKSSSMLVEIYAVDGKKVFTSSAPKMAGNRLNIDIGHLPKGAYYGRLQHGDRSFPLNFIKE
ncbi:Pectate lyase/Amb allergen [Flavobacteriaceae bacterium 3519-10]|nr:Pectate lyase/Amb allergen [Flavobacteriaceae bacterium 3519-10]